MVSTVFMFYYHISTYVNTFPANFHPIEVLSRYRDLQLQVAEN